MAKLTNEQRLELTSILKGMRGNRREFLKGLDTAVKLVVPAIHDGNNIADLDRVVGVLNGSADQALALKELAKMVGYNTDEAGFTNAKSVTARKKAAEYYKEFLASGRTFWVQVQQNNKPADKPELTAEEKLARVKVALGKDIHKAMELGMSPAELLDVVSSLVAQEGQKKAA